MPIYEFQCSVCDEVQEVFYHKYNSEDQIVECSECGASAFRILSNFRFNRWDDLVIGLRKEKAPEAAVSKFRKKYNYQKEKQKRKIAKYRIRTKKAQRGPSPKAHYGYGGESGGGAIADVIVEPQDRAYVK
uniref:Putative regulatory protein FmdB zinc ribbon domain-containing protein n=1 Tax=viral metagenome TaxID=1070528 RepID=A0A6M3K9R9_9ZZZZ